MLSRVFLLILIFTVVSKGNFYNVENIKSVNDGYTSCTVFYYDYKNGDLDSNSKRKKFFNKYNYSGEITEETSFHHDNSVEYTSTYIYNKSGKLIEKLKMFQDNDFEKTLSKYNDKSEKIEEEYFSTINGSNVYYSIFKYNEKGYQIEKIEYMLDTLDKSDTAFHGRNTAKYNAHGRIIEVVSFDDENSLKNKIFINYDTVNLLSIDQTILTEDDVNIHKEGVRFVAETYISFIDEPVLKAGVCLYDADWHGLEMINFRGNGKIGNRETFKYDVHGNKIERIFYYDINTPLECVVYIYSK